MKEERERVRDERYDDSRQGKRVRKSADEKEEELATIMHGGRTQIG